MGLTVGRKTGHVMHHSKDSSYNMPGEARGQGTTRLERGRGPTMTIHQQAMVPRGHPPLVRPLVGLKTTRLEKIIRSMYNLALVAITV